MKADCHIHMILDGENWKNAIARHKETPDIPWIRKILEHYRNLGFTYLRDGGDRWNAGKTARELAKDYGITYKVFVRGLGRLGADLRPKHDVISLNAAESDIGVSDINGQDHFSTSRSPRRRIRQETIFSFSITI